MKLKSTLIATAFVALAIPTGAWAACSAAIDMGTNKITNMGNPTDAQDATTKAYVDAKGLTGASKITFQSWNVAGNNNVWEAETAPTIVGADFTNCGANNAATCTMGRTGRVLVRGVGGLGSVDGSCAVRFFTTGSATKEYYLGSTAKANTAVASMLIADVVAGDVFHFGKGNMPNGTPGSECRPIRTAALNTAPALTIEYIE